MHGVSKALVYQQDAYLLQLRDCVPTISYPDRWSFFGGEIELGESPWQALQRELEEELEWRPHCGRFLYEWINPENPCRIHFFAVPFSGDRSALVLHEGQDLGWFTLDEIADNLRRLPMSPCISARQKPCCRRNLLLTLNECRRGPC